jgi:hydrogenase maturation factor
MGSPYPLGKLPPDVLASLLYNNPIRDPRVVVGPRPGEDAAVLDAGGSHFLVAKTDPITFATGEIGWYAVHVNANDIATTGGTPAWFMATILLPEHTADRAMVEGIFAQVRAACDELGVSLVGGHTEITYGIDRPIITGVMLGLVDKKNLILTSGAQPGDTILVTKGAPIEATAIIARERGAVLESSFAPDFLQRCADYLHSPGISVVRDAQIAVQSGRVHAMHDPTEGGLATGLWEMAEASGRRLLVNPRLAVLPDSRAICEAVGLDPLGAIASGALFARRRSR